MLDMKESIMQSSFSTNEKLHSLKLVCDCRLYNMYSGGQCIQVAKVIKIDKIQTKERGLWQDHSMWYHKKLYLNYEKNKKNKYYKCKE